MSAVGDGRGEIRAALGESRRQFAAIGRFNAFVNLLMLTGPLFVLQVYDRVLARFRSSRCKDSARNRAFTGETLDSLSYREWRPDSRAW